MPPILPSLSSTPAACHVPQNIKQRATASQGPKSTPAHVFAQRTVHQVLRRSPPRRFVFGHMAGLFRFMRRMPLWLIDRLLMKMAGIRPPAPRAK